MVTLLSAKKASSLDWTVKIANHSEASGLDGIEKSKTVAAIRKESGVSGTYAYRLIDCAEQKKAIVRRKDDKLYLVPGKG